MNVWRWPIITAILSSVGLVAALFFDGWGDVLSWIGLGIPVVQSVWYWRPGRAKRAERRLMRA